MSAIYPSPRWFTEAVSGWLDEYEGTPLLRDRISDLFTRIVNAQPPSLRVVAGSEFKGGDSSR